MATDESENLVRSGAKTEVMRSTILKSNFPQEMNMILITFSKIQKLIPLKKSVEFYNFAYKNLERPGKFLAIFP